MFSSYFEIGNHPQKERKLRTQLQLHVHITTIATIELSTTVSTISYIPNVLGVPARQDSLANSPEAIKSAVRGSGGILAAGLTPVSPSTSTGMATTTAHSDISPGNQLLFAGLEPKGRYTLYLCTESNSGSLSGVTVTEAMVHSEAPLVS